jgi:hypothetical protein
MTEPELRNPPVCQHLYGNLNLEILPVRNWGTNITISTLSLVIVRKAPLGCDWIPGFGWS